MADRLQPDPATAKAPAAMMGAHLGKRARDLRMGLPVATGAAAAFRGCTVPTCTPVVFVPAFKRIRDIGAFPAGL